MFQENVSIGNIILEYFFTFVISYMLPLILT